MSIDWKILGRDKSSRSAEGDKGISDEGKDKGKRKHSKNINDEFHQAYRVSRVLAKGPHFLFSRVFHFLVLLALGGLLLGLRSTILEEG